MNYYPKYYFFAKHKLADDAVINMNDDFFGAHFSHRNYKKVFEYVSKVYKFKGKRDELFAEASLEIHNKSTEWKIQLSKEVKV